MTVFYLVITFINNFIFVWAFLGIDSVAYSVSIYLMLDHNIEEYVYFLKGVKRLKLHWCCCCCGYMVTQQYNSMKEDLESVKDDTASPTGDVPGSVMGMDSVKVYICTRCTCQLLTDLCQTYLLIPQ